MKVLVIIPAYNEELNIKKVVSNLIDHYPQYNYVVVNDGSADSTSQICHQEGYFLQAHMRKSLFIGKATIS